MKILVLANCSWFLLFPSIITSSCQVNPSRLVTQPKTRALISIYGHGQGQTRNLAMWFLSQINFTHTTPMVDPFLHSINWILIGSLFINVIQSQRAEQKREIRVSKYQDKTWPRQTSQHSSMGTLNHPCMVTSEWGQNHPKCQNSVISISSHLIASLAGAKVKLS